ncbi:MULTISPECIES: hypothetical protein [unclassified Lentimonas]|uniref:hypothetical protein n=1 Tax=unclassified Lentimonas TaxID=2630993 RepID=UPI001A7E4F6F|nr:MULTISPECIES: hypothetical protein [unclassified Lentimonas]
MKTTLFTAAVVLLPGFYVSAGDLTPPVGPPSSTMKTLDEIEPRIPIDPEGQTQIVIDTPGHYFFTKAASIDELAVQAGGVTIDFGGFAHSMQNLIGVSSDSSTLPVILRNGTLLSGTAISAIDADNDLRLEKLHFEGGSVNFEGSKLLVRGCTFVRSSSSTQDFALQLGSASLDVDGLAVVGYPIGLNMPQTDEHSTYVLKNITVSGSNSAIALSGLGAVSLMDFQMNGDTSAYPDGTAIELENDVSLFLRRGVLKGYVTLIQCSSSVSLRAEDTQFLIYNDALSLNSFQSSLNFERCVFSPVGAIGASEILLSGSFNGGSAIFRGCTIERLNELVDAPETPAYGLLSFKDCSIKALSDLDIPGRSVFVGGLIEMTESYGPVRLFEKSRFRNVEFSGSGGTLELGDGVSIVSSSISGFNGVLGGRASLRDTQVIAGEDGGLGLGGDPSSTFLLSGSVVEGFTTGLSGGTFILNQCEILECGTAIDVEQITVRDSVISADDLGRVNGRAIILGSVFRAGANGLVVDQVQARDTVFDCSDKGAGTALEIENSGSSVVACSFSGFGTGVSAGSAAVISDNSFLSLIWAVDGQAPDLNITDNVIADCENGINAADGALIRNNHVFVSGIGIQGSGLIVQNTVVTASAAAYNLGNGTIGRELTGDAINPAASPAVEDAGEPWANVWESLSQ